MSLISSSDAAAGARPGDRAAVCGQLPPAAALQPAPPQRDDRAGRSDGAGARPRAEVRHVSGVRS